MSNMFWYMCLILLILVGILIYLIAALICFNQESKKKKWMDNYEYDYGHDIRHDSLEY